MAMHKFKQVTKEEFDTFTENYGVELVKEYHTGLSHRHYMYKDKSDENVKHPHNVVAYRNGDDESDFVYFVKE